jgi:hypothetical protein
MIEYNKPAAPEKFKVLTRTLTFAESQAGQADLLASGSVLFILINLTVNCFDTVHSMTSTQLINTASGAGYIGTHNVNSGDCKQFSVNNQVITGYGTIRLTFNPFTLTDTITLSLSYYEL